MCSYSIIIVSPYIGAKSTNAVDLHGGFRSRRETVTEHIPWRHSLKTHKNKRQVASLCWWPHAEPFLRFRRGGMKRLIRRLRAGGLIFLKSWLYKPYINTIQVCSSPAGLWASHPASSCSLFFKNSGGMVRMTGSHLRCRFNLLASFSGWCGWMEGPGGPCTTSQ